ncbi:hypothetical protein J1N35_040752 [Gossypium stocksii]|uniref:Aminotransferase-like plant mobile domain-containing protein n=1 Tax=Gossypium stocksii TaxID=47602 RepID=A0A9D3UES4_9ROSI|nr:hypothetical protein J1N35_040752 [Gossypium stocksii]
MAKSLICFDGKHISDNQLQMKKLEYRILETYICNLPTSPLSLIESYLRDARFLHVARIGRRYKLNPTLLNVLVEKWRPETHTFHLPCGECTITLEDIQLQLELLVNRPVVTGSVITADLRNVCEQLLKRALNTIYRAQIDMNWLKRNFGVIDAESSEVEREQHVRAYIFMIIGGLSMFDKSRNLVYLRWLLKLVDFREMGELS